jgi:hypothetical protein
LDERQKLSVVINHWIEHNQNHMGEYQRWAQKADELGLEMAKGEIERAIGLLFQLNSHLEKALTAVES